MKRRLLNFRQDGTGRHKKGRFITCLSCGNRYFRNDSDAHWFCRSGKELNHVTRHRPV